jgi:vacuolar-type H+-ATPase subunit F/Vma7
MGPLVVLGDEATCAGFALAGVEALSPSPSDAPGAFARALASASMVVVTHDPATAARADRIVRLDDGRVVAASTSGTGA